MWVDEGVGGGEGICNRFGWINIAMGWAIFGCEMCITVQVQVCSRAWSIQP